jgi:hypothetical protein
MEKAASVGGLFLLKLFADERGRTSRALDANKCMLAPL